MAKIVKNKFFNFLVICLIFMLMTVWIYSGWPRIWNNPPIPPRIQETRALTTDTYYGTYDSVKSTMTNPVNAETDNTQYAYGVKNTLVVIQSWSGTAGSGTISGVRIYCQHYATTPDGDDYTLVDYSLDDWVTTGATTGQQVMPASESSFSVDITADRSWTWTDIGNLEVRATAKASTKPGFTNDYIDVLYIQVDYTPAAELSITAPATANFPDFTIGTGSTNALSNIGDVDFSGNSSTWDVTVYLEDDFTCSSYTISISGSNALNMNPQANGGLEVVISGDNDGNVSAQSAFDIIATGSGNQYLVVDGGDPGGTGTYRVKPALILDIPGDVEACSPYQGTIVFTIS